ncbi:MAG: multiubiquitin domain-containing protein [Sciscionella sp.]
MTAEAAGVRTKQREVIVNGRKRVVTTDELTFDEVVALAYDPVPSGPNWVFTITYRRGGGRKPEGTLRPGESVKVKEGMIFNVTATDKS